jgi:organic radical activating enzyme
MLNLFITYNCNFNYDYCFIHGFKSMYPDYLGQEDLVRLCAWLEKNRVCSIGILGGEPTLHPRLVPMLRELNRAGVAAALFTNGLFPQKLIEPFVETVSNFVVNYNDPSMYTDRQWSHLQDTLGALHAAGASVSFSKNFSKRWLRFDYILEACAKFGISHIRYDISRPNPVEANNYFNLEESHELVGVILEFVRKCESRGIDTGMD